MTDQIHDRMIGASALVDDGLIPPVCLVFSGDGLPAKQLSDDGARFYRAVNMLRLLSPKLQQMALYAATFWSEEHFLEAEANGDAPGNAGALLFESVSAPKLKLVKSEGEKDGSRT